MKMCKEIFYRIHNNLILCPGKTKKGGKAVPIAFPHPITVTLSRGDVIA